VIGRLGEHGKIAPTPVPEAKVIAHHQKTDAQCFVEQRLDERFRRLGRQSGVESQAQYPLYSQTLEDAKLVAQPGNPPGRGLRGKKLAGLGLEQDHHIRQCQSGGSLVKRFDHRLMTAVDAVKIADGRNAPPVPFA
jgi:hypothetical protein